MISQIKGDLTKKEENYLLIKVAGITYTIYIPQTVYDRLYTPIGSEVELIIYHFFAMDQNRGVPVMIGFLEELERDFFIKFTSVSGIGPKAALKAFDKPVAHIARAIEEADAAFLKSLAGIGPQKAKQIIAALQGKVGRFALLQTEEKHQKPKADEVIQEAKQVLKRLQYSAKEIDEMVKKVLDVKPDISKVEDLLNEIYKQKAVR